MKTKFGISGGALKWLAILLMAIDHVGASLLENFILNVWDRSPFGYYFMEQWESIYAVDQVIRGIGRPAFPIFCFLLVEGFVHTHDVKKYAFRLGVFVMVSEIPFDLAFWNMPFHRGHQNVFLTLLIGLLAIWLIRDGIPWLRDRFEWAKGERMAARLLAVLLGCALAELFCTDYGAYGILLIIVLYVFREYRLLQCIAGALCISWELPAPLAFLPIYFYNGKRGWQPKWFFYWFYPAHLLLYWGIGNFLLPMAL